jgi:hypothetical protein
MLMLCGDATSAIFYPEDGDSRLRYHAVISAIIHNVTIPEDSDLHDHRTYHDAEICIGMIFIRNLRKIHQLVSVILVYVVEESDGRTLLEMDVINTTGD